MAGKWGRSIPVLPGPTGGHTGHHNEELPSHPADLIQRAAVQRVAKKGRANEKDHMNKANKKSPFAHFIESSGKIVAHPGSQGPNKLGIEEVEKPGLPGPRTASEKPTNTRGT